jgi:hypothetical protein
MAVKAKHAKVKATKRSAPKLLKISEEMKEYAALLGSELATWPKVSAKPMFGMTAFYRDAQIFAALPKTRALTFADAIIFKMPERSAAMNRRLTSDAQIDMSDMGASGWISLRIGGRDGIRSALKWLDEAYRVAAMRKK